MIDNMEILPLVNQDNIDFDIYNKKPVFKTLEY